MNSEHFKFLDFYKIQRKFDLELISINLKNKIFVGRFRSKKGPHLINEIRNEISQFPFANVADTDEKFNLIYYQGKRIENCDYYEFKFAVKKEYWNGDIDENTLTGRMLKFVQENNIRTIYDIKNFFLPHIYNLNRYAKITSDKNERKKLYGIKKSFIKFMYKKNLIDKIERQISDVDRLYRFTIGEYTFHLREFHTNFLTTNNHPLYDKIYTPYIVDPTEKIDTSFYKYFQIIEQMHQDYLLHQVCEVV